MTDPTYQYSSKRCSNNPPSARTLHIHVHVNLYIHYVNKTWQKQENSQAVICKTTTENLRKFYVSLVPKGIWENDSAVLL